MKNFRICLLGVIASLPIFSAAAQESESQQQESAMHRIHDLEEEQERLQAQVHAISKNVENFNKLQYGPRKTQITPSTRSVLQAMFYVKLQRKIEEIGTCTFPTRDGKKLYGELLVYIPVFQDGSIYQKEHGVRIERSSGNLALDEAAIAIVDRAAPFEPIPQSLRTPDREDVWEVIFHFNFTKDDSDTSEIDCGKKIGKSH